MNKHEYVSSKRYKAVVAELEEAHNEIEQLKAKVAVAKISHTFGDSNDIVLTSFLDVIEGGAGFENIPDGTILYMFKEGAL